MGQMAHPPYANCDASMGSDLDLLVGDVLLGGSLDFGSSGNTRCKTGVGSGGGAVPGGKHVVDCDGGALTGRYLKIRRTGAGVASCGGKRLVLCEVSGGDKWAKYRLAGENSRGILRGLRNIYETP